MATPVPTNREIQPTAGKFQPKAAEPPLKGRETAFRQMLKEPAGVPHDSTRRPRAS